MKRNRIFQGAEMKNLGLLSGIAFMLLVIGGINIGLEGLFDFNLILTIFGRLIGRLIFIAIGISAGYLIYVKFVKKSA